MGTSADALTWSGSGATLSMFIVSKSETLPELSLSLDSAPLRTRTYVLEDEDNVLPGHHVFEYDFVFTDVPSNLDDVLQQCLRAARAAGAEVAWFGFEGSFDFGRILTKESANQVYAVADPEGVSLASDETLPSKAWQDRVVRAGENVRSGAVTRLG